MHLFPVGPNPICGPATILEISNDNISGMGGPIAIVFYSTVKFLRTTDQMVLLPFAPNLGCCPPLGNFK